MAAAHTAALPLPVPAQPDCKFATIFSNTTLSNFDINPNNITVLNDLVL